MLRIKLFIFSLACAGLFLTSCEDDLTGGGLGGGNNASAPEISLPTGGADIVADGAIIQPGATFRVLVEGESVENDLNGLTILLDGVNLPTTDFDVIETVGIDDSNPVGLFGDNASFFSFTFEITAPTDASFYNYEFVLSDVAQPALTSTASISIEVQGEAVDPILDIQFPSSLSLPAESVQLIPISAVSGSFDLASISIWENGSLITDLSRIRFNGVDFEFNPLPLFDPDTQGFDAELAVVTTTGTNNYVIRLTDTEDNSTDFMFEIVEMIDATPLSESFELVLFSNNAGMNLGGVDLDGGVAVTGGGMNSDPSPEAEIIDLGIDSGEPNATNWRQQIGPVNGSELRFIEMSALPEGFTFAGVASKEEVAEAFVSGDVVSESPRLQVGDLLAVESPTNLYLIRIDEIEATETDNNDFYSISIKY